MILHTVFESIHLLVHCSWHVLLIFQTQIHTFHIYNACLSYVFVKDKKRHARTHVQLDATLSPRGWLPDPSVPATCAQLNPRSPMLAHLEPSWCDLALLSLRWCHLSRILTIVVLAMGPSQSDLPLRCFRSFCANAYASFAKSWPWLTISMDRLDVPDDGPLSDNHHQFASQDFLRHWPAATEHRKDTSPRNCHEVLRSSKNMCFWKIRKKTVLHQTRIEFLRSS